MIKIICSKCNESFNTTEIYCTECYYTLINKIRNLEIEQENLLLEIKKLKNDESDLPL